MIDIHSHILPGIDDGATTEDESVEMVRRLADAGVTEIVATPHFVEGTNWTASREQNQELLEQLKARLESEGIDVKLALGNEIQIGMQTKEYLKRQMVSTLGGSEYVLVEMPMSGVYPQSEDILLELMNSGYKLIMAHPERYVSVQNNESIARGWYEMGVLLQCNLGSLVGQYGKAAQRVARKLMQDKIVFTFGSDIHYARRDADWKQAQKRLRKYYSNAEIQELLVDNPRKILRHADEVQRPGLFGVWKTLDFSEELCYNSTNS